MKKKKHFKKSQNWAHNIGFSIFHLKNPYVQKKTPDVNGSLVSLRVGFFCSVFSNPMLKTKLVVVSVQETEFLGSCHTFCNPDIVIQMCPFYLKLYVGNILYLTGLFRCRNIELMSCAHAPSHGSHTCPGSCS